MNGFDDFDTQVSAEEFYQHSNQDLSNIIAEFLEQTQKQYGSSSYAAGYFSAWIRQIGENDANMRECIIRDLTYALETR